MAWQGRLQLDYRMEAGRTVGRDTHHGPLRVLKRLYPEGSALCHHVLVHPPGGLVAGDHLEIDIEVHEHAQALVTTPGATRFYRSTGDPARQSVDARIGAGARLEWLPMETIAYRGTHADNRMRFQLADDAQMIGWDLLALGLPASDAPFDTGRYAQRIDLPGAWLERGILDSAHPQFQRLLDSPLGWDRQRALATMWCACGNDWPAPLREALLEDARAVLAESPVAARAGASAPAPGLVLLRALADRIEPLWTTLQAVRDAWRARLWQRAPETPRVWHT